MSWTLACLTCDLNLQRTLFNPVSLAVAGQVLMPLLLTAGVLWTAPHWLLTTHDHD